MTDTSMSHSVTGERAGGRQEVLLFEDYGKFDDILVDANRSAVSVANGLVDIRALLRKEESMARDITARVEERAVFLRQIEDDLKKEAGRLRAVGSTRSGPAPSGRGASGEAGPSGTQHD